MTSPTATSLAAADAELAAVQREAQDHPGTDPDYAAGTRYALDFHNSALGDPYLFDTAYRFDTAADAEAFADRLIPRIDQVAKDVLAATGKPVPDSPETADTDLDWRTWAVVTSERRDAAQYAAYGDSADPAVEYDHHGPARP